MFKTLFENDTRKKTWFALIAFFVLLLTATITRLINYDAAVIGAIGAAFALILYPGVHKRIKEIEAVNRPTVI